MGRTFENRKGAMMKRWDRMAKAFSRCGKEIAIATRSGGPNPDANPALRRAIQNARSVNMPKDKIEAAIKRGSGEIDGADYQELLYEAYGPHGVPILVETATDNPTRTISNLRLIFKKGGGNIGSTGSVSFMFDKRGAFRLNPEGFDAEELELELIDHGLEDMGEATSDDGDPLIVAYCAFENFGDLHSGLEGMGIEPVSTGVEWVPHNLMDLGDEQVTEVLELIDKLEQDDDVQDVFHALA